MFSSSLTFLRNSYACAADCVSVEFQASKVVAYEKPAPTGKSRNIMLAVWEASSISC